MLLIVILVLVVLSFSGGFYPGSEPGNYPYRTHGFGLGTLLLIVLLVLFLTHRL